MTISSEKRKKVLYLRKSKDREETTTYVNQAKQESKGGLRFTLLPPMPSRFQSVDGNESNDGLHCISHGTWPKSPLVTGVNFF